MIVQCPHCEMPLKIAEDIDNQRICCSRCGKYFNLTFVDDEEDIPKSGPGIMGKTIILPERPEELLETPKGSPRNVITPEQLASAKTKPDVKQKTVFITELKYKTPILASIFRALGFLLLVAVVLGAIQLIMNLSGAEKTKSLNRDAILLIVAMFSAVFNFGLAQVIVLFAKTAYYAEKISTQLDEMVSIK